MVEVKTVSEHDGDDTGLERCCLHVGFSVKHPLFAMLGRYSEWILNHLVRTGF